MLKYFCIIVILYIVLYELYKYCLDDNTNYHQKQKKNHNLTSSSAPTCSISPTNLTKPTSFPTNFIKPTSFPTNSNPTSFPTNSIPTSYPTNSKPTQSGGQLYAQSNDIMYSTIPPKSNEEFKFNKQTQYFGDKSTSNDPLISNIASSTYKLKNESKTVNFDQPHPWTRVDIVNGDEFPFRYYIKIKISSLNEYQNWKQLVPNLDFNANTGELIIPSKDEGSALALANLIIAQLQDQISLQDIINKNLLQISVAKAQAHEVIRTKLRDQILDNINAKKVVIKTSNYQEDLATETKPTKENKEKMEDIEAFDGNDYSSF